MSHKFWQGFMSYNESPTCGRRCCTFPAGNAIWGSSLAFSATLNVAFETFQGQAVTDCDSCINMSAAPDYPARFLQELLA
jgi:hypothetical protein